MIHQFSLRNFVSFADEAVVDFRVGGHAPETSAFVVAPSGQKLTKLVGVFGANGSGKTNLLKGLSFLRWFMLHSFKALDKGQPIPVNSFAFGGHDDVATMFDVLFEVAGEVYRYEWVLTSDRLLEEVLYKKGARNFGYLFKRTCAETDGQVRLQVQNLPGINPTSLLPLLRENCSLLSVLQQTESNPLAAVAAYWSNMESNVSRYGRNTKFSPDEDSRILSASRFYHDNPSMQYQATGIMSSPTLDFGLSGLVIELQKFNVPDKAEPVEVPVPYGLHRTTAGEFRLPLKAESSGTRSTFLLLRHLLPVLANGGIAVMDEFEVDLHPHMIPPILELFINPETNPKSAQLLFTCHSAEVLQRMDKTQVLLVEKDEECRSQAWRLDSMKGVRRDDNLYAKYMAGAYGAVPNV